MDSAFCTHPSSAIQDVVYQGSRLHVCTLCGKGAPLGNRPIYQPGAVSLQEKNEFLQRSLVRVAEACGIETPLQLIELAENDEESYVDLLIKAIKRRMREADGH